MYHHPYGHYGRLGYYGQAPTPASCNRAELERRVNACIEQTRRCAAAATAKVGVAFVRCGGSHWCRVAAMARYWRELRRCRENLLTCDRIAKRDTGCA